MYSCNALVSFFCAFLFIQNILRPSVGIIIPILIFSFHTSSPFAIASETASDNPYAKSLIQRAREKQLAQKRHWLTLGHYKKKWFGGYKSEADAPEFFVSPEGKTSPEKELSATLLSFFKDPKSLPPKALHPQCQFPARYKWLKRELKFDPDKLPKIYCARLDRWLKKLDPHKITLVFASFYMGNPSSMFGHTLLRIDSKSNIQNKELLNYGVNYAANPDTSNP
ncbi:MAG: DUF4105 domain-containing protein, partial [candidate division Zixibacteria bacterium]|nr:DUF4105 domain-containing protein [candidate division Zixibacteria bacterium]